MVTFATSKRHCMRKAIGISETVFDILFKNDQPLAGVPGGSVLNCVVSLGRTGTPCCLMSETGDDHIGQIISDFLTSNGVSPNYVVHGEGKKTAISLAFLDENNDAHYSFYKDYQHSQFQFRLPDVGKDDVIVIGSYFALIPSLRPQVRSFLETAKSNGAIIYYDVNFRPNHIQEKEQLMPVIHENFQLADIVRGSADDFRILYGYDDADRIWNEKISPLCGSFILTRGADGTELRTGTLRKHFDSRKIQTVSTIGAGDSFNAGILYGLIHDNVTQEMISSLTEKQWNSLVGYGIDFSSDVCQRTENYISRELAEKYRV